MLAFLCIYFQKNTCLFNDQLNPAFWCSFLLSLFSRPVDANDQHILYKLQNGFLLRNIPPFSLYQGSWLELLPLISNTWSEACENTLWSTQMAVPLVVNFQLCEFFSPKRAYVLVKHDHDNVYTVLVWINLFNKV